MKSLFAQAEYSELQMSGGSAAFDTAAQDAMSGGVMIFTLALVLISALIIIPSLWKMFQKAGRPGWAAIVPVYNSWVLFEISGKPGWWALTSFLGAIPILGLFLFVVPLVLSILAMIELARRFGKDTGFAVLMILLPIIAFPMLAFGKATYNANAGAAPGGANAGGNPPAGPTGSDAAAPPAGPAPVSSPVAPGAPVQPVASPVNASANSPAPALAPSPSAPLQPQPQLAPQPITSSAPVPPSAPTAPSNQPPTNLVG